MEQKGKSYQDTILAHAKAPRGLGAEPPGALKSTVENSLCGDAVTVALAWGSEGGAQLGFVSAGCSLCRASASIMIEALHGLTPAQTAAVVAAFTAHYRRRELDPALAKDSPLRALYDLQRFPSRSRCVLLPWDALSKLLYT